MADRYAIDDSAASVVLARRYRRLLFAYPPQYRAERGEEIVSTLLDGAAAGQRAPRPAEAADLVASGLRRRLGVDAIAGVPGGLALAAPVALALAAGISLYAWWRLEPAAGAVPLAGAPLFGRFRTLGPVAYAAWLFAVLARAVLPTRSGRAAAGLALAATTLGVPVLAVLTPVDRPPLWVLMALAGFGAVAVAGTGAAAGARSALSAEERIAPLAGAVAVALATSTLTLFWHLDGVAASYYQPTIARIGISVGGAVAAVVAVAVIRFARGRPSADWLWAAVLLGLPAGWFGPFGAVLATGTGDGWPHFGRLAQVLLASCAAVVTMRWLAGVRHPTRHAAPQAGRVPVVTAGSAALGCAAGTAAFAGLVHAGAVRLAPGSARPHLPPSIPLTLAVLAVVGLACLIAGAGAGAGAGGGAGAGAGGGRRRWWRAAWPVLAGAAGTTFGGAWLVASYANEWTLSGWTHVGLAMNLVATTAMVPVVACAYTAVDVLRDRGASPVAARPAAAVVLLAGLGWLAFLTVPYVLSWAPALLVFAVCAAVSRPRARTG